MHNKGEEATHFSVHPSFLPFLLLFLKEVGGGERKTSPSFQIGRSIDSEPFPDSVASDKLHGPQSRTKKEVSFTQWNCCRLGGCPKKVHCGKVLPSWKGGLWASLRGRNIFSVNVPSRRYLLEPSRKRHSFGTAPWSFQGQFHIEIHDIIEEGIRLNIKDYNGVTSGDPHIWMQKGIL